MGKLTTATWLQGAVLAFGHFGLMPGIAKAEYGNLADYSYAYPPAVGPEFGYRPAGHPQQADQQPRGSYRVQRASYRPYQAPQAGWQAGQMALPPELAPYDPGMAQQYPAQRPRAAARQHQPIPSGWARPPAPSRQLQPASLGVTEERKALVEAAYRSLGITYRWGGNSPREGFDCSGLTKFSLKHAQVSNVPRTALEQSKASRTISRQQLRPGDMIFFRTSGKSVNHVGIYVGNGKFIHAASGGGKVTLDDLRRNYWQQRLVKYGTFLA